jgi:2,6-dihydroxypyridine 3-monooxygenase
VGLEGDADGVEVLFEDSPAERFHLVVGADGVHSTVRGVLFPEVKPAYAGYVAWRGTLDEAALPEASAAGIGGALTYFVTHGSHILSYAIPSVESGGRDRLMNWVWYRNVSEGLELEALLTDRHGARHDMSLGPGDVRDAFIDELRAEARRVLPAAFAELVGASQWPFVQVVVDIVVPAMAVGRTCLIGDAAFALRPHIAAGTAKAAADAAALAEEIRGAGGDVSAALGVWAPRQLELGRAASARTREVGERVQFEGTYRPGDATVAFGLFRPKDSNFPETQGPGE